MDLMETIVVDDMIFYIKSVEHQDGKVSGFCCVSKENYDKYYIYK